MGGGRSKAKALEAGEGRRPFLLDYIVESIILPINYEAFLHNGGDAATHGHEGRRLGVPGQDWRDELTINPTRLC